jgi:hypothetical protein
MTDDDFEKRMEFIIDQQASFAARMGQLEELVARFAQATSDRFQLTDRRMDEMDERISALVDAQICMEENVKETSENVKKTDESLRNLIAVVDRYFSAGRNDQAGA